MKPLLEILYYIGFIDFIILWYSYFNDFLSVTNFKIIKSIFALVNILYILCARYIFYPKITNINFSSFFIVFKFDFSFNN